MQHGISMSAGPNLNRESLQNLLADAFAVQESGIDAQSLLSLIELERSIAMGEADVDQALQLIADVARKVADASGVAIALLETDQLVYRAASGIACTYIGRPVRAVLSVSACKKGRYEILRVEDTETDKRIEADICRQFGARSLLILPIYRRGVVAGVLEVMFNNAHTFPDCEVHTYRLIAGLVQQAVFGVNRPDDKVGSAILPTSISHALVGTAGKVQSTPSKDALRAPTAAHTSGEDYEGLQEMTTELGWIGSLSKFLIEFQPLKRTIVEKLWLKVARRKVVTVTAVIAVIAATWLNYHRHSASVETSGSKANVVEQQVFSESIKPISQPVLKSKILKPSRSATKARRSTLNRVRVSQNGIDHIGDDVTIRHFTSEPPQQPFRQHKHVSFGDDVTVRYFSYNRAPKSQTEALPPGARPEPTLPAPK